MQVIELTKNENLGATWCCACDWNIDSWLNSDIARHLNHEHGLVEEDPNNFSFQEDAKIAEMFGSFCRREFGYYRQVETGELVAVRIR